MKKYSENLFAVNVILLESLQQLTKSRIKKIAPIYKQHTLVCTMHEE